MNPKRISKVLIVDDQAVSRRILESMLIKSYRIFSASSGSQAIDLAKEYSPDMVLLDIEMPEMDGFETMHALRNGIIADAVPVIFLTAREDSESREKGLIAGAVDYITKPYDRQELSIKVKNHLALYEARKEIEHRNKLMAREMEMASQLQNSLLPATFPEISQVKFAVYYKPLSKAGGDFYDIIELNESNIGVVLVDVSGHGVASAMIGAMFKMCFTNFARSNESPAQLLSLINDEMVRILPDSDFLTVFYCIMSENGRRITYCNAGHPRPILYSHNTKRIEELATGGPLVGAFPNMMYEDDTCQIEAGDCILIYTDGITEARSENDENQFYGLEQLMNVFTANITSSPDKNMNEIVRDVHRFHGNEQFDDDLSLILISFE